MTRKARLRRWSDVEIAELDAYLAAGLTFGRIARRMPERTRNAIIAYDWRRRWPC